MQWNMKLTILNLKYWQRKFEIGIVHLKFILFIFLTLAGDQSFGQKDVTRESFMINVRPVLNGLVSDFYQMITLFPDFPQKIIPLMKEMDLLNIEKNLIKEICPRTLDKKCRQPINNLLLKISKAKLSSTFLLSHLNLVKSNDISSIAGMRIISEFDLKLEELKVKIENSSLLISAGINQKIDTFQIIKDIDELETLISLAFIEHVPLYYKQDFRNFYFDFIRPIEQQISNSNNHKFLTRNMNSLNFSINLLVQTLTKRKKTPQGMSQFLNIIHNRWNSIIRYYF